jgi:hypothetical protein
MGRLLDLPSEHKPPMSADRLAQEFHAAAHLERHAPAAIEALFVDLLPEAHDRPHHAAFEHITAVDGGMTIAAAL